jgi:hypothetical protein
MKILALDGGGVFGFAQARILSEAKCCSKFDCFVGTSIGSAIAAALATNKPVGQQFFDEWMPKIFKRSFLRRFNPFVPKYPDIQLVNALQSVFGDTLMKDAKKPLFVTAANLLPKKLKVFYSGEDSWPMWQVIRCATAAETYFKPYQFYSDGGIFANNCSMVAVSAACKKLGAKVEDIELLSIGAGKKPSGKGYIPRTVFGWGRFLIEALLTGSASSMHQYFVSCLPLKKYVRIQFASEADWHLDSVSAMKEAEVLWEPDIQVAIQTVKDF